MCRSQATVFTVDRCWSISALTVLSAGLWRYDQSTATQHRQSYRPAADQPATGCACVYNQTTLSTEGMIGARMAAASSPIQVGYAWLLRSSKARPVKFSADLEHQTIQTCQNKQNSLTRKSKIAAAAKIEIRFCTKFCAKLSWPYGNDHKTEAEVISCGIIKMTVAHISTALSTSKFHCRPIQKTRTHLFALLSKVRNFSYISYHQTLLKQK